MANVYVHSYCTRDDGAFENGKGAQYHGEEDGVSKDFLQAGRPAAGTATESMPIFILLSAIDADILIQEFGSTVCARGIKFCFFHSNLPARD